MSYWSKKNEYNEKRINDDIKKIFNEETKKLEIIKLSDFINSIYEIKSENKEKIIKKNIETLKNFNKFYEENSNVLNEEYKKLENEEKESLKTLINELLNNKGEN